MTHPSIKPAQRLDNLSEYYLQNKMAQVARMNAQGLDIISLGIGGPDGSAPQQAIEATVNSIQRPDTHSYQLGNGLPQLRQAYARWYKRKYGVTLDPETEILPLIGSKEGILHISLTFLNPGDKVLVPDPGYPTYTSVTNIVGATPLPYDLTEQNGWMPDFDALENTDLTGVKLMWVNYPHMPTGTQATTQLLEQLVDFGRRHNILIAQDNPYSFILNRHPHSILAVDGAKDIAIELNSLSKSHNMAGWRMGMVAAAPQFITWIRRIKSNIDSGQFRPMMEGAIQALDAPDSWYDNLYDTYAQRRQAAEQVMRALQCTFDPTQRGMFLWGRLPDTVHDTAQFVDDILNKAHVFITPGFIFGKNGQRYIRISLCSTVDNLQRAAKRITNLLHTTTQQ